MPPLFLDATTPQRTAELWPIVPPLLAGAAAVYLLLPRPRLFTPVWGALAGVMALLLAGWLLIRGAVFSPETVLFYAFAGITLIAAGLLITLRNPAHAALSFALVVLSTCGLFLLQAAPFLMAATIIIYAGAIVVTFLFVLMLAQQEGVSDADFRSREPLLSTIAGFVLLGALLCVVSLSFAPRGLDPLVQRMQQAANQDSADGIERTLGNSEEFFTQLQKEAMLIPGATPEKRKVVTAVDNLIDSWPDWQKEGDVANMKSALDNLRTLTVQARDLSGSVSHSKGVVRSGFSVPTAGSTENVAPLGRALFTDYLLAVELGGTLLLAATIGAIAITHRRREGAR